MDSNEIALLELLATKPLSYFPPQPYMIARRLARRGLVAFKDGHWYPTAEGQQRIGSMKSSNDQAFAKPTR
jgi:hypothetical protein